MKSKIGGVFVLAILLVHFTSFGQLSVQPVQSIGEVQPAQPDSVVAVTANAYGLSQTPLESLPVMGGTFWIVETNGVIPPFPCLPVQYWNCQAWQMADGIYLVDATGGQIPEIPRRLARQAMTANSVNSVQAAVDAQGNAVANLIEQVQNAQFMRDMAAMFGMDAPMLDGGNDYSANFAYSFDTNALWLEITNVSNGYSYYNLHNATNLVYAILTTTNLLTPFTPELEVWPSDTNCQPFNLQNNGRQYLFVRAEDWTGVDSNGDGIPDWWIWKFFGDLNETATQQDGLGHTFGYDYANGFDPNVVQFTLHLPLDVITSNSVNASIEIYSGKPAYMAVLINDTNQADAIWQPYSSNVVVNLNSGNGVYNISIGLRGLPADAQASWQSGSVALYSPSLALTLTSPASSIVSQPMIQLQGFANKAIGSVTYDVSNAAGIFTNQTGFATGQFYDTNYLAFTMNYFQCYDVVLTNGVNTITLHVTDLDGNTVNVTTNYTLNYSGNHIAPALSVLWPADGAYICGSTFTLQGQMDDATASITATIVDENGNTNIVSGLVERSGMVWVKDLPLGNGANTLTISATDAAGNASTTSLTLYQSPVTVTLDPLTGDQLNHSTVTVFGTVSDASYQVYVNGVQATVNEDGTWEADGVSASSTGTALFDVKVYAAASSNFVRSAARFQANDLPSTSPDGDKQFDRPQPAVVVVKSFEQHRHEDGSTVNQGGKVLTQHYDNKIHWTYDLGGSEDGYEDATPDGDYGGYWNWSNPMLAGDAAFSDPNTDYLLSFWQHSIVDGYNYGNGTLSDHTQTHLMIRAQGQTIPGNYNYYLVRTVAGELADPSWTDGPTTPLPPEWLQINGQALNNTGITNDDDTVWGVTMVSAPAGADTEVTPVATQIFQYDDYSFDVQVLDITRALSVDNNRDGSITADDADATSPTKPFHFWVNDSKESGDIISGAGDQIPGSSSPNYARSQMNGRSDLVNYFPVTLSLSNLLQWLPLTNGFEYHLVQNDSAVRFVYTSLTPTNVFDYLTNTASTGYGPSGDEDLTWTPATILVTGVPGVTLDTNWLTRVQNNGGVGVILTEGCATTAKPLWLEIWRRGQLVGGVPLYLSIDGVETMFRHLNLRDGADAPSSLPGAAYSGDTGVTTQMGNPANFPDDLQNNKWLIFVHGYNVSAQNSRGWEAEMFKRFYWSGSKAKFVGVDWLGNPEGANFASEIPVYGIADYYLAEMNAFATAPQLASKVNALAGSKTIVGHSLGCELTAFALNDFGLQVNHACLMDAAVAQECFDGDADDNLTAMQPSAWQGYDSRLFAAHWHELFDSSDARSTLTWRNRFANALTSANVYSFYSSTEDVLAENDADPTTAIVQNGFAALSSWSTSPLGNYAWVIQEKTKGSIASLLGVTVQGSDYGGWGFNPCDGYLTNYPVWYKLTGGGLREMKTPSDIGTVTQDLLNGSQFNPLFKNGWGTFNGNNPSAIYVNADASLFTGPNWILGLYQPNQGGTVAADPAKNTQLLAQAIPALSLPVGVKFTTAFDNQNYNMPVNFTDGTHWPNDRGIKSGSGIPNWHHSDISQVAYPYLYKLFNQLVLISNQ